MPNYPTMYKVKVNIYLKENILDPQGKAVNHALQQLGFSEVESVRVGKHVQLLLSDVDDLENRVKSMCSQLLVNEVMEDMDFSIEKINS
jgi:phosphoribosylformylglycinamidine synthase PurS subunit